MYPTFEVREIAVVDDDIRLCGREQLFEHSNPLSSRRPLVEPVLIGAIAQYVVPVVFEPADRLLETRDIRFLFEV